MKISKSELNCLLKTEMTTASAKVIFKDFRELVKENYDLNISDTHYDTKKEDIARQAVMLKKDLLILFTKMIISELRALQKKGQDGLNIFLGSLAHEMDDKFTKLIFKKDQPSWRAHFKDLLNRDNLKQNISKSAYADRFERAFDIVFGKGTWRKIKELNKSK